MSRKVYFTEEQLKHIMGEDAMGGYLKDTSPGSEFDGEACETEIIPTETTGEPDDVGVGDTRTEDAYASQKIANNQWTRRGAGYSLYEHNKKKLNERNAELDDKNLYSLPKDVRAFATPDGEHDKIMKRLRSCEQMDLSSLYRLRNELRNSPNTKITGAIDSIINRAQSQGEALRNVHTNTKTGLEKPQSAIPGKGHRKEGNTKIYYENN